MTSKWSFLIFGLVAVAKAQQGYPRENPSDQLVYNSRSQMYNDEEVSSSGDEIPGEAGKDYPIFRDIPETQFDCGEQQFPGYYADIEARCQVFHICQTGGRRDSFLCPNGTVFNQEQLVCDWWLNFDCEQAQSLYSVNEVVFRAMQEADRIAAENRNSQGYRYNTPNGLRNQQQRPSSSLSGPQSNFDTVVIEAVGSGQRSDLFQKSESQHEVYDRPEVARRQPTGRYTEDNRKSSQITHATFGKQISVSSRDSDAVYQEPEQTYLPTELQSNKY